MSRRRRRVPAMLEPVASGRLPRRATKKRPHRLQAVRVELSDSRFTFLPAGDTGSNGTSSMRMVIGDPYWNGNGISAIGPSLTVPQAVVKPLARGEGPEGSASRPHCRYSRKHRRYCRSGTAWRTVRASTWIVCHCPSSIKRYWFGCWSGPTGWFSVLPNTNPRGRPGAENGSTTIAIGTPGTIRYAKRHNRGCDT